MIWIGLALVAIVGLALTAPLWVSRTGPVAAPSGAARDVAVYRDQLRGLEADLAAGRVSAEEADRLRAEVGRRLLEADRAMQRAAPAGGGTAGPGALTKGMAAVGVAALMAGSLGLYSWLGAPEMPDAPRAGRIADAQLQYDTRPSQAEAEALAGVQSPVAEADIPPDVQQLMTELRTRMQAAPEARGLRLLADFEARLGNLDAAAEAFRHLLALEGHTPAAEEHIALAGVMIEAAGGLISPEAEAEISRALALEPGNQQGLFLRGLLLARTGRPDLAFPLWRRALAEGPTGAPVETVIRQGIMDLAWMAGEPGYMPPPLPAPGMAALPGPDADAVAAAEDMGAEDRAAMIDQMVTGLEERLSRDGGTPAEWARLVQALAVQGQTERAAAILLQARETFSADGGSQAAFDTIARQLGLD